jgi:hypothetical protein
VLVLAETVAAALVDLPARPRLPAAGRPLDLYARRVEGRRLHPGESDRITAFEAHYREIARPFDWTSTI